MWGKVSLSLILLCDTRYETDSGNTQYSKLSYVHLCKMCVLCVCAFICVWSSTYVCVPTCFLVRVCKPGQQVIHVVHVGVEGMGMWETGDLPVGRGGGRKEANEWHGQGGCGGRGWSLYHQSLTAMPGGLGELDPEVCRLCLHGGSPVWVDVADAVVCCSVRLETVISVHCNQNYWLVSMTLWSCRTTGHDSNRFDALMSE